MNRLLGRVALVTGSSSGIGAGVAEAFAREGADVAINHPTDRQGADAEAVAAAVRATGRRALVVQADVASEEQVEAMFAAVSAEFGLLDILVNNAGIISRAPVEELTLARWDRLLAVHLTGTFLCTRAALRMMKPANYGRIVNTASQLAYLGAAERAHYGAAKAGIIGFTRSVALELGTADITINCVAPGATDTPMLAGATEEFKAELLATIPKGRFATVADLVGAYVYLASEEARHLVGQCISPNGGDVFL